jgi:plastocyanin
VITIKNFGYSGSKSVSPGATVMVMNQDSTSHTVTADSGGAFDVTVSAGGTATFTAPSKPGSYPYHCNFHAEMHGSLTVK